MLIYTFNRYIAIITLKKCYTEKIRTFFEKIGLVYGDTQDPVGVMKNIVKYPWEPIGISAGLIEPEKKFNWIFIVILLIGIITILLLVEVCLNY